MFLIGKKREKESYSKNYQKIIVQTIFFLEKEIHIISLDNN